MCEADIRNQQALYILENEWGCGRIDIGRLRSLLRGSGDHSECEVEHARAA